MPSCDQASPNVANSNRPGSNIRAALVFGGSGQIGVPLLGMLSRAGWQMHAVSRNPQPSRNGVRWLLGDLERVGGLPPSVDAIFSCGPLDHFARWYAATPVTAPRVIVFGSTSAQVKSTSPDPVERDLAMRLQSAERSVFETASARQVAATVLRPTLIYGAGRDRSLTRIAQLASRWGWLALPRGATGLRQPVHVDDLAATALACVDVVASHGRVYALPGGETLQYRQMIARVLTALSPPPRLVQMPAPLFAAVVLGARIAGRGEGFGAAVLARLREDLVFDVTPARTDLNYAPRTFRPEAAMFQANPFILH